MPAAEVVVSDTSPVLNLALIDRLELLDRQFGTVDVPRQVWSELTTGEDGLSALESARSDGLLDVVDVGESRLYVEFRRKLDRGEAAAIQLAIENDADRLLVDEREGRQVARRHGLSVTGVVGVLLRAGRDDVVDVRSELNALRDAGFWISDDLYETAIERANDVE